MTTMLVALGLFSVALNICLLGFLVAEAEAHRKADREQQNG